MPVRSRARTADSEHLPARLPLAAPIVLAALQALTEAAIHFSSSTPATTVAESSEREKPPIALHGQHRHHSGAHRSELWVPASLPPLASCGRADAPVHDCVDQIEHRDAARVVHRDNETVAPIAGRRRHDNA